MSAFEPDGRLLAELAASPDAAWKYFLPAKHPHGGARRVAAFDRKSDRSHALYALGQKASFAFQVVFSLPLTPGCAAPARRVRKVLVLDRDTRFDSVFDKAGLVSVRLRYTEQALNSCVWYPRAHSHVCDNQSRATNARRLVW